MKILQVITSLKVGGAETLVVNLVSQFYNLGHEVGIAVFNYERTPLSQKLESECPSCKIYKLGSSYYNPYYIFKLAKIMQEYDIIHTHNSSPQLFVAIANNYCRRKIVTTEHSTNNRKREFGTIFRYIDKWMYRNYHQVICISDIAQSRLLDYLGKGNCHICTINNGVDIDKFYNAQPVQDLSSKRFVVAMVAGFREAKDQDTVIRAISILPKEQFELWLIGDGVRRQYLENLSKELNVTENIRFLGIRSDVHKVLKSADIVVMSSHWEGLSLSNIEGMASGKPFIASDVNGLREVTSGYGILFPHGDYKSLAQIIQRLSDDKNYYKQIADRCYERAKEYDISKTVKQYNDIYLNLL